MEVCSSHASTLILHNWSILLSKSCDFVSCVVGVHGQERVGSGGVQGGGLSAGQQVVEW